MLLLLLLQIEDYFFFFQYAAETVYFYIFILSIKVSLQVLKEHTFPILQCASFFQPSFSIASAIVTYEIMTFTRLTPQIKKKILKKNNLKCTFYMTLSFPVSTDATATSVILLHRVISCIN